MSKELLKLLPTEDEIYQRTVSIMQNLIETDYEPFYDMLHCLPQPQVKHLKIVPRISVSQYLNSPDQPLSLSYYYKDEYCFNIPLYFRLPPEGYPIIAHVVTTTNDVIQNTQELEAFLEYNHDLLDPNKKLVGLTTIKYNIKQYIKLKEILIRETEKGNWTKDYTLLLPKPLYGIHRFHYYGISPLHVCAGQAVSMTINTELSQKINDQIQQNTIHQ